jgi:predicted O-methyltransferase YrrM
MMRKIRTEIVYATMKFLTPGLYRKLKALSTIPDTIDDMPRPMIKYLVRLNRSGLVGAEVGVSQGNNALSMFDVLDIKRLYLVDPYLPYDEKDMVNKIHIDFKEQAFVNLKRKPVVWFVGFSVVGAKTINEPLDFVYIDANHDYQYVKEDIEAWYPLLKVGGVIGGHDFNWKEDGVIKAVTEFANSNKLHLSIMYPDWWVQKE